MNGVLGLIVLGLAVQIVRTWARALPPVEVAAGGGKGPDVPVRGGEGGKKSKRNQAEKAAQTPAALVTAIVDKDLLDPSRTKQSEEVKATPVVHVTEPPPGVTLAGIRIFGKDREAFIIDASMANTQRRLRSGDPIGNFTVKAIRNRSVVLVSEAGDIVTLRLELDKTKSAPATGVRQARPAAAGSGSPAAGLVSGTSTAAGAGAPPKTPVITAGGRVVTTTTTLVPGAVPAVPTQGVKGPREIPQLPAAVREKIQQMNRDRHR